MLWKRSTDWFRRRLARAAGVPVRALDRRCKLRFNKVAEYQRRGALHFHAVIRLDGVSSDGSLAPPPPGFSAELLERAIRETVAELKVATGLAELPQLYWGSEVHVRHLRHGAPEDLSREAVAGYVAKYSTKSSESLLSGEEGPSLHIRRLMATPRARRLPRARRGWRRRRAPSATGGTSPPGAAGTRRRSRRCDEQG